MGLHSEILPPENIMMIAKVGQIPTAYEVDVPANISIAPCGL